MTKLFTPLLVLLMAFGCTRPDPSAQFKDATQAMRDGEYREAIELFTAIVAREPTNDAAYINRAACHAALKEDDLMLSDADEALTINGKNVAALELLASYWLDRDNEKAREYALRLIEVEPDNAVAGKVIRATGE